MKLITHPKILTLFNKLEVTIFEIYNVDKEFAKYKRKKVDRECHCATTDGRRN